MQNHMPYLKILLREKFGHHIKEDVDDLCSLMDKTRLSSANMNQISYTQH